MIKGFDTQKYIEMQRNRIIQTVRKYEKLYFEFGGKLIDDYHACRILPGFELDAKLKLFHSLKDELELVICINSENIQNERIRSDYNTLYTEDCIRLIDSYRELGFFVSGVALTLYKEQPKAVEFAEKLKQLGEKVYFLKYIENYPNDFEAIIKSFDESDFIETTRSLVILTSSGSASGKLSACLSQIYKERNNGKKVGYAKYDIFPVWNLPINHPINLAFEAATADSEDKILVDHFYYKKYNKIVSNYNRDLNLFPVIRKILGEDIYSSPTEMVINTMADAIIDDKVICQAGKEEVCRRYFTYYKQYMRGQIDKNPVFRVKKIMDENDITFDDLPIIKVARKVFSENSDEKMAVIEFEKHKVLVSKETEELSIGASIFNVALIEQKLIAVNELEEFSKNIKRKICIPDILDYLKSKGKEYEGILNGYNVHVSYIISLKEESEIKSLGINLTCEPYLEN